MSIYGLTEGIAFGIICGAAWQILAYVQVFFVASNGMRDAARVFQGASWHGCINPSWERRFGIEMIDGPVERNDSAWIIRLIFPLKS